MENEIEHQDETWTREYEQVWYIGYVLKFDEHYWIVKLEGAQEFDRRYRVYCHKNVVAEGFGRGIIGTRVRLRLTPNRKEGSTTVWEALECVVEPENLVA
jgi:hypothetical protein